MTKDIKKFQAHRNECNNCRYRKFTKHKPRIKRNQCDLVKHCPSCGKQQTYTNNSNWHEAVRLNTECYKCSNKQRIPNKGWHHTTICKKQMSESRRGKNNPFFGKTFSDAQKLQWHTRKPMLGKKMSVESRKKISDKLIERLQNNKGCFVCKTWNVTMPSGKEIQVHGYERLAIPYLLKEGVKESDMICGIFKVSPIEYVYERSIHKYFPDIFIKSTNTIIEVKSDYLFFKELEEIKYKANATVNKGYNYRVIIFNGKRELVFDKTQQSSIKGYVNNLFD